ncbi:hypothetical protein Nepgr_002933 [Nepenthes gracilis]|uniref:Uncharacterized protein n=1 Tax=Nepenthes gracilis TaxID=150966 RepID=A0AAD3P784_NEPGR|nr:hypothetical protein Nepgr_002933 [Nepenthes gracilis]
MEETPGGVKVTEVRDERRLEKKPYAVKLAFPILAAMDCEEKQYEPLRTATGRFTYLEIALFKEKGNIRNHRNISTKRKGKDVLILLFFQAKRDLRSRAINPTVLP